MNAKHVMAQIAEVLEEIQALSGYECPTITPKTIPIDALPKFDSKIWPVATCLIAEKLKLSIGNDVNIFCDEKKHIALSLEQIAEKILGSNNSIEQSVNSTDRRIANK